MKDLYTFCKDKNEQDSYYEKLKKAYVKIFDKLGIGAQTFVTFASGGLFSKYSNEFQTVTDAGEDIIYINKAKKFAVNKEVLNEEVLKDLGLKREELVEMKAVEVGNIFNLGTRFSDALALTYKDEKGESKPVWMGSYGIGPGRVMGAIVELKADEKGIVWPKEVAPFFVHLIEINPKKNPTVKNEAEKLYQEFLSAGIEVLWDDREATTGEKFADSDLIGIPVRMIISEKTIAENIVEVKKRASVESEKISRDKVLIFCQKTNL